jgi:Holliday junction DNA helicase RuvA
MIDSLQGIVQHMDDQSIVLEVGGVGIRVEVPSSVLGASPGIGKPFFLHTKLMIRDDKLNLFGFVSVEQRDLFDTLLKISGIGPRLALAILSYLSPEVLQSAIVNGQAEVLVQVPGIGKKTAERILFYMKDKLEVPLVGVTLTSELDNEVLSVLTALGYSLIEAQSALQSIPKESVEDIETRVRLALQYFTQ